MKKRDIAAPLPKTEPPRGVLRPPAVAAGTAFVHERFHASPDLDPFIEHFWGVAWDLAGKPAQRVGTLPHPSAHLTFEPDAARLGGISRKRFARLLKGRSFVFGIKFRPASFHAFYGRDLSSLTDRRVPPARVFGPSFGALERAVLAATSTVQRVKLCEAFLRKLKPVAEAEAVLLNAMVAEIARDRGLNQVEQLVGRFGRPARQLQRWFRRYLGVSPKWVIARYRIHEALERVHAGTPPSWAGLAIDLGYADQAHFIRDFKALVGQTPRQYQRQRG